MHFDFSVEIFSPDGGCETVVEITAPLPSEAEALFRHTVDKLADTIANIPSLSVTESLVLVGTNNIDSVTFPEVSRDTKDSVTFKDNPVTESLVSDATKDSVTFKDSPVTESLVSDATKDSVTFKDSPVTESLVSDATKDSVTAINIYEAKGTARGNRKYFRYSYKEVGKVKHLHIGGGNIHSLVAQSRMELVKDALAQGQSPNQIKRLIQGFRT